MSTRGLVVVGDARWADDAVALAERNGWPLLAEPAANAHSSHLIAHAPLVLTPAFTTAHAADVVVTFGRFGLSRPLVRAVRTAGRHLAVSRDGRIDPLLTAQTLTSAPDLDDPADPGWLAAWQDASARVHDVVTAFEPFSSLSVVRDIGRVLQAQDDVLLAASRTVRDAEMTWAGCAARVFMNRGANGIDGLISTAWGIAAGGGRHTLALLGDLAFLHDLTGLLGRDGSAAPDLTLVVLDNDGGGIFSSLEQGAPAHARHFERVFGTPQHVDIAQVAATLAPTTVARTPDEVQAQITRPGGGVRVVVVPLPDRAAEQASLDLLRARAAAAVDR